MQNHNLLIYFKYLDKLAHLGVTNMRKADIYLEGRFLIEREEAKVILNAWLTGFGKGSCHDAASAHTDRQLIQLLSN